VSARSDFGARLKQARDSRGLSLREIAATTKISVSALEALEHGDGSRLPGGIFSRAFVRSYAAEVGIDPEGTVREFLELFPSDTNPVSNPSPTITALDDSRERGWGRMALASLVLTAAAVTSFVLMGWVSTGWLRLGATSEELATTLPAALPTPAAAPVTAPAPVSTGRDASTPPAPAPEGATAKPDALVPSQVFDVAQVTQSDVLRLVVKPTDRCWVHIVADGTVVFAREMSAGEREAREARASFVVTVGNAAAFTYTINDAPGRPLGGEGKVVKVRIDRASLPEFLAN
jgi:cytoskeleton protein RodZ